LADAAVIIHHSAPKKKIAVGAYFIKTLLGFQASRLARKQHICKKTPPAKVILSYED